MGGQARIHSVFRITGRGWAVSLDDLSDAFLVKAGDFVTLEKDGIQLQSRPILHVEFMDKRGPDGRMHGYVSLILSDRHSADLRVFEGGTAIISTG